MKRKRLLSTLLATLLVLSSAALAAQARDEKTLKLKKGKCAAVGNLKLGFLGVLEDSRCPQGVQCIWAGNAQIRIAVWQPKHPRYTVELNTQREPKEISVGSWTIRIIDLLPLPKEGKPAKEYTVTLGVAEGEKRHSEAPTGTAEQ